jgi:hypothetical protein
MGNEKFCENFHFRIIFAFRENGKNRFHFNPSINVIPYWNNSEDTGNFKVFFSIKKPAKYILKNE